MAVNIFDNEFGAIGAAFVTNDWTKYNNDLFFEMYNDPKIEDFPYSTILNDNLTYGFLERDFEIGGMATPMAVSAHAKSEGFQGADFHTAKLMPYKTLFTFGKEDMKRVNQEAAKMGGLVSPQEIDGLSTYVANGVGNLYKKNNRLLSYISDCLRSTGSYEITAENNPDSPMIGQKFEAKIPTANRKNAGGFGTKAAKYAWSNSSATPVADLQDMYEWATDEGLDVGQFEMSYKLFATFCQHANTTFRVFANKHMTSDATIINQLAPTDVTESQINNYLVALGLPTIKVINTKYNVPMYNKDTNKFERNIIKGFDEDIVVLRPSANWGVIKTERPSLFMSGGGNGVIAEEMIFNERTLSTRLINLESKTVKVETEETSMPILLKPSSMVFLNTSQAAS